jgi:hypothetical protein
MTDDRDQEIRERAYAIWESEGRPAGSHEDHWNRAARELSLAPQEEIAVPATPKKAATPRKKASVAAAVNGNAETKPASIRKRRPATAPAER